MKLKNTRRGFTQNYFPKGFTLIELLVVVLIIGILAAVAVPQYQKAVEKSRMVEAISNLEIMKKCAELYVLEKGKPEKTIYFQNWNCPIELSGGEWDDNTYYTKHFMYEGGMYRGGGYAYATTNNTEESQAYVLYLSFYHTQKKACYSYGKFGNELCHSLESQGWKYGGASF